MNIETQEARADYVNSEILFKKYCQSFHRKYVVFASVVIICYCSAFLIKNLMVMRIIVFAAISAAVIAHLSHRKQSKIYVASLQERTDRATECSSAREDS